MSGGGGPGPGAGRARPWRLGLGLLLLAAYAATLGQNLAADLPGDLDQSVGIIFDPPSKNHNARNRTLWGEWVVDDWTPLVHSPIHTWLQAGVFRLFGTGLAQIRLLDVAASTASLGLLFLLARACLPLPWAALAAAGAATSYPLLIYGRSGLLEPLVLFFGLLTVFLLSAGYRGAAAGWPRARTLAVFAAAGLTAGLSFLAKATAWPYVLAAVLLLALRPPARRGAIPAVLAGVLPVALWYVLVFVPEWSAHFHREVDFWAGRAQHAPPLTRWLRQNLFDQAAEFRYLLAFGVAVAPLAFAGTRDPAVRARRVPLLAAALVFLLGSQFLAFIDYRPFRYGIPYLPLTWLLAAWGLSEVQGGGEGPAARRGPGAATRFWLALSFAYAGYFGLAPLVPAALMRLLPAGAAMRFLLAAAAAAALVLLGPRLLARAGPGSTGLSRRARTVVAALLAAALFAPCIGEGLARYRRWAGSPAFTMRDFSRRLGRDYRDLVVGGTSPLFAVMENTHRAVKVTFYNLNHPWVAERRLTHLLLPRGQGVAFRKEFPGALDGAVELARPIVAGHLHVLYALRLEPMRVLPGLAGGVRLLNADPHSPQTAVVLPDRAGGETAPGRAFPAASLTLLPGQEAPLAPVSGWGTRVVDLRLLRPAAGETETGLPPPVFDAASPVFRAAYWDGAKPLAISRESTGAAVLLLHVRAAAPDSRPARFVLRAAGAGEIGERGATAAVSAEGYAAVALPADGPTGSWTLSVEPPRPLWVDLVAAVGEEELERATLWRSPGDPTAAAVQPQR